MKIINGREIHLEIPLDDQNWKFLRAMRWPGDKTEPFWTLWQQDSCIRTMNEYEVRFIEAALEKGKQMTSNKRTAYLAGPITGLNYEGATSWREEFETAVGDDIECLSPMRGKQYLLQKTNIADEYNDIVLSSQRAIFCRDMWDCNRCDILVVNLLEAKKVSIGTVMEIAWAAQLKKPIVLIMEKEGNPHEHAMVREACAFRVEKVADAIKLVKTIANVKGMTNALC